MCEYLKRMSPQGAPTDDIRLWSGLAHSVVEHTGPGPFGMDGSVYLWLHERSVTQLLDMCDELDAKFSGLMLENAKLRELVRKYGEYTDQDRCEGCACKSRCNDGDVDECWQLTEIRELARKLKVEVEE